MEKDSFPTLICMCILTIYCERNSTSPDIFLEGLRKTRGHVNEPETQEAVKSSRTYSSKFSSERLKKTMSVRTHGRCVNMVLLHGTCSISMKTLVNVTLENKLKKNSLLNLVLLLFLSYDDVALK